MMKLIQSIKKANITLKDILTFLTLGLPCHGSVWLFKGLDYQNASRGPWGP